MIRVVKFEIVLISRNIVKTTIDRSMIYIAMYMFCEAAHIVDTLPELVFLLINSISHILTSITDRCIILILVGMFVGDGQQLDT